VDDGDAVVGRGLEVDVDDADPGPTDHRERRRSIDDASGDGDAGVDDEPRRVTEFHEQGRFGAGDRRARGDVVAAEHLAMEVSIDGRRLRVGDQDVVCRTVRDSPVAHQMVVFRVERLPRSPRRPRGCR